MTTRSDRVCRFQAIMAGMLCTGFGFLPASLAASEHFADIHIHFNWDQKELIEAGEVVEKLRRSGVVFAVAIGTPSPLALELKQAGNELIVPLFSPYTHEMGRQDWYLDSETVRLAEEGLRDGRYRGIGEVHFMYGFKPAIDNAVFQDLARLAEKYQVPMLVHVDAANEQPFVQICRSHPGLRLQVAHAGGNLKPVHVRRLVEQCDNAMIEFSARDPWRYDGLTGGDGLLLPGWRALVLDYPKRFMTGTDPVWKVTRTQTWDQADDGWDYFEQLIEYHRRWIADLPPEVARRVRLENALDFYDIDLPVKAE